MGSLRDVVGSNLWQNDRDDRDGPLLAVGIILHLRLSQNDLLGYSKQTKRLKARL